MVIRLSLKRNWPKGVFLDTPPGGEDHEVADGRAEIRALPFFMGLASEDGEDAGVAVVEGHRVHDHELVETILVGKVVAMPSDHVKARMALLVLEELAHELAVNLLLCITLKSHSVLSYAASGTSKSRALARPLAPIGPWI